MREKREKRFLKDIQPIKPKRNILSCNSCHNLATAGVDNQGHKGQLGGRNSPSRSKRRLSGSVAESV